MDISQQKRNHEYFKSKIGEWLEDPLKLDKYVLIYDEDAKGMYDTFETAYKTACAKFPPGFIIQQIVDESKIVNYLSPAVIS